MRIPSGEFNRICQQLGLIGNTIGITVTKQSVQFACSGDMGNGKIVLNQTVNKARIEDSVNIIVVNPVSMVFALRFLHLFSKASSISSRVRLAISKDLPACMCSVLLTYPHYPPPKCFLPLDLFSFSSYWQIANDLPLRLIVLIICSL